MTPPQRILLACIDTANILHPHLFHDSRKFTVYFAVAFHLLSSLAASTIAFGVGLPLVEFPLLLTGPSLLLTVQPPSLTTGSVDSDSRRNERQRRNQAV
jgi:hypothetical protein